MATVSRRVERYMRYSQTTKAPHASESAITQLTMCETVSFVRMRETCRPGISVLRLEYAPGQFQQLRTQFDVLASGGPLIDVKAHLTLHHAEVDANPCLRRPLRVAHGEDAPRGQRLHEFDN